MTNSVRGTLRDMHAFREQRLANGYYTPQSAVFVREELRALAKAIEFMENNGPITRQVPQGPAWDHHFAVHSECDWDWTGLATRLSVKEDDDD